MIKDLSINSSDKQRLHKALVSMGEMYKLWTRWKDDQTPNKRRIAIKAKTYGIIYYDRIMVFSRYSLV